MGVNAFNINQLLRPYRDGGTKESPVQRSLETIATTLIVKYRFPPDVAGAAIFLVFHEMAYNGLIFKGDGSYGSRGAELFSCIKAQAADIASRKATAEVIEEIAEMTNCTIVDCPKRKSGLIELNRWQRLILSLTKPRGWWNL